LPKKDKARVLQPLYNTLNEAKGHNHLTRIGCANVHFIPESAIEGQKTPDLGADAQGRKVLCDIKTINISDKEAWSASFCRVIQLLSIETVLMQIDYGARKLGEPLFLESVIRGDHRYSCRRVLHAAP
jgi:hypothetical protein